MVSRLLAVALAAVCGVAALHLSGVTVGASTPPVGPGEAGPAASDALQDIAARVDAPAELVPSADGRGIVAAAPFAPIGIEVPAAGVRAPVDPLGLDAEGALEVPEDGARAGWWSQGVPAGGPGPAVVVGHVDHQGGSAGVFHALELVAEGDIVRLASTDGRFVEYVVTSAETVRKATFPTEEVYGPTDRAELRLVTCGGPFNPLRRSYRDNLIVFAELVDPAR